ncbi:MAG: hypothetical protein K1X53_13250 [Candidatus Sumerlaeaceae bacterium]|nr:hypothetical protein [Candidatus Sumerlaeaceae bacterium]
MSEQSSENAVAALSADEAAAGGDEPLDVAAIMAQIRRQVAEKKRTGIYPDDPGPVRSRPALPDFGAQQPFEVHYEAMRSAAHIDLAGEPISSHRPVTGNFIVAVKRFTRFWIRRYTDSLFMRQSYFNAEAANTIAALRREIEDLRAELDAVKAKRDK